jgi:nucleotide-binding universal stress UspA family protein
MDLAREHSAALDVVTVESPDCEVTGLESTEEKLARYVEPLRSARVRICSHLLFGEPGEQIRKFVDKADTGYLVISSHTTPRAGGGSVGSTAGELLKNSPAPLWIIRPTLREAEMAEDLRIGEYPCVPFFR